MKPHENYEKRRELPRPKHLDEQPAAGFLKYPPCSTTAVLFQVQGPLTTPTHDEREKKKKKKMTSRAYLCPRCELASSLRRLTLRPSSSPLEFLPFDREDATSGALVFVFVCMDGKECSAPEDGLQSLRFRAAPTTTVKPELSRRRNGTLDCGMNTGRKDE